MLKTTFNYIQYCRIVEIHYAIQIMEQGRERMVKKHWSKNTVYIMCSCIEWYTCLRENVYLDDDPQSTPISCIHWQDTVTKWKLIWHLVVISYVGPIHVPCKHTAALTEWVSHQRLSDSPYRYITSRVSTLQHWQSGVSHQRLSDSPYRYITSRVSTLQHWQSGCHISVCLTHLTAISRPV